MASTGLLATSKGIPRDISYDTLYLLLPGKGGLRLGGILLGCFCLFTALAAVASHCISRRIACVFRAADLDIAFTWCLIGIQFNEHESLFSINCSPPRESSTISYYCTHDGKRGSCLTKRHRGNHFSCSSRSMIFTGPLLQLNHFIFQLDHVLGIYSA